MRLEAAITLTRPLLSYSPEEERDQSGKWTTGGLHYTTKGIRVGRGGNPLDSIPKSPVADLAKKQAVAKAVTFFHGTTTAALKSILTSGLQPGFKGGGDTWAKLKLGRQFPSRVPSVYLTPNVRIADTFGDWGKEIHPGSEKVVLKYEIPKAAAAKLKEDEMFRPGQMEDDYGTGANQGGYRSEKPMKKEWLASYKVDSKPWTFDTNPDHIQASDTMTLYAVVLCLGGK